MTSSRGQLRRTRIASFVLALVASFVTSVAACARGAPSDGEEDGGASAEAGAACQLCVTDQDCADMTLARPTTYTFIIRHEPRNAYQAPGCAASEAIMAKYPYTLAIVGHTHTYGRTGARQVTIGNGGAPLVAGTNYGYGIIAQRADGTIGVDMIDYASGQADASFHFALHPDGSSAP